MGKQLEMLVIEDGKNHLVDAREAASGYRDINFTYGSTYDEVHDLVDNNKYDSVICDIFFPKGWLDRTFSGYNSRTAVNIINQYLEENPELSPNLRGKVQQSADMVFRAERELHVYFATTEK